MLAACTSSTRRPRLPAAGVLEAGLAKALAVHREWAGRLGVDADGERAILLNDAGVRLVEATADVALFGVAQLLEPAPEMLALCPNGDGVDELMLVQVTRFTCGSFVVGTTTHHTIADGRGRCEFMNAWGNAARGGDVDHVPMYDRASVFAPRKPPRVAFEHRGVEFIRPGAGDKVVADGKNSGYGGKVVVHAVHFTPAMLSELKLRASAGAARPYSTLQCVAAHIWRCITKARGLNGDTTTMLKIPVNGRPRMRNPPVPEGYSGNVVLWAHASTTTGELRAKPLRFAVELISRAVARVDDSYFRSFVDFASSGGEMEAEELVPEKVLVSSPHVFLSNLQGLPVYDLDLGTGRPFFFTRCHSPWEGYVFIVPRFSNDGSMDVHVGLYKDAMEIFKSCCYSHEAADRPL